MKLLTQVQRYKTMRKDMPPPTRIERPLKGRGYRRRQRNQTNYVED